jgi:primosomal protein N' (replication factor Y) (superfamily II helicase)
MAADLFGTRAAGIARVALPVPVDRLFDYAVPPALASEALVGRRVRVPAGARGLTGVVVAQGDRASPEAPERLRAIEAVLDAEPVLAPALLGALLDEARQVLCPVGVALAAALPPGSAPRSAAAWSATPRGREALSRGAVRGASAALLARLAARPLLREEAARLPAREAARLDALVADRLVAATRVERGPRVRAARERWVTLAPGASAAGAGAALRRAPAQLRLLEEIAQAVAVPARGLVRRTGGAAALRALAARGLVAFQDRPAVPRDDGGFAEEDRRVELTAEQHRACAEIGAAVRARRAETFLLHGVTGSGKTEVYLRAVAEALALGRQALVLVPEISLTHQIVGRLRARFGDRLAVLHSALRPGDRLAAWERLRRGETPIAVGARSALFAPVADLGLVVIDEEHDSAYKNEEGFRYHARRLAARRARADGCPLLLGSATPSLETRHDADTGRVRRLRLAHRIASRPLPAVEIVDLARERALVPRGRKLVLTAPLRRAVRQVLAEGGQAILFLNRRGFSTQIACNECQHVSRCKHCDIALTYHASAERLRCHYCGFEEPPPEACPACGARAAALLGIGTERLEEEVVLHFPDARVARLDRDTAARRGAGEAILRRLRDGELDILVGTQMVAKGHDFPGVRLVGVVHADLGLHFPDFRAAERTFQLLTQVAGRAGRGAIPGRVVIQTWTPDHYAIRPVVDHDYERFYSEELAHRSALGYPPLGHLALVRVDAPDEQPAREAAESLARGAREQDGQAHACEVLGPAPAPISRLRGRHRFQILLKHGDEGVVWRAARRVADAAAALRDPVRASVDVTPLDML